MDLKPRALVLRRQPLGESDALLSLFAPDLGRFGGLAKGVRKAKTRPAGGCDQFVLGRFLLRQGRSLAIVQQVEVERGFLGLRKSLPALAVATYLTELTGRITIEHEPQPELFELLVGTLAALEDGEADAFLLRHFFELRALTATGYAPQLDGCVQCGARLEGPCRFSPAAGGVLCSGCSVGQQATLALSAGSRAYLLHLRDLPPDRWGRLRLSGGAERELDGLFGAYLRYHFEMDLRSAEFVRTVWQQCAG